MDAKNGYVYFALDKEKSAVKIGFTRKDPQIRIKQLNTGNSSKLELIHFVESNGFITEKYLHRLFSDARIRQDGEWFYYEHPLIKHWIANSKYRQSLNEK